MAYGAADVIRGGDVNVEELTAKFQKRLTDECDGLREAVLTRRFDDFDVILKGKRSVNVVWDEWKRRLFGVQTENAGD
jgi:predicted unusual protein kinase regulating ubiquinone biosynthesis (AarF/ABC1/UbiB family)